MQAYSQANQPAPQMFPCLRVMLDQGPLMRKVKIDPLGVPPGGDVGGRTDRSRATAHHDHRPSRGQPIVVGRDLRADLSGRLHPGSTPEAVAHPGRDNQSIIGFGYFGSIGAQRVHHPGRKVDPG